MRNYRFRDGRCNKDNCCPKHGFKRKGRGRPPIIIQLDKHPEIKELIPTPILNETPIYLSFAEYEAIRLVDLNGLNQEDAGELMNISRTALWRLINSARNKLATSIVKGQKIIVSSKTNI